jgi:ABC-type transport system substrate-binding protein
LKRRPAPTAAALAVALAVLVGCRADDGPRVGPAGSSAEHAPRRGGHLRFAATDTVSSLDPAIAYDELSFYPAQHLFDTLVGYAPVAPDSAPGVGITLVPQLAERWESSSDGLHLRFHLRAGLRYHDGAPIVAGDFKYALERILHSPDSPFAGFLTNIAGCAGLRDDPTKDCSGLRAPDPRTLEIDLQKRDASFLYVLAMKLATPLRRDYVERVGAAVRERPLASGPYQLTSWQQGRQLVLTRNPYYWDQTRAWIETITLLENVPHDVELLMFERGELDVCYQPASPDYLWFLSQPAWRPLIRRVQLMNVFGERMDVTRPPFADVRVRRALNYAFNKAHTLRLLQGTATAAHGILPPGMHGYDAALAPYPYDPERAKQLLAEAGYPRGFSVDYVTLAGDEPRKLAASLQADLDKVGVHLRISELAIPAYQDQVGKRGGSAMSFTSWIQDYPDPSSFFDARFHSRMISDQGSLNDSFYANPAVDALIDEARREPDAARRDDLYRRLERLLYDDAPWIWGYHRVAIEVVQPYLRGYAPHPVWIRDYSSAWLDLPAQGSARP